MSEKRYDKKHRLLQNGETQCKDGRYRFTFYENGKQKSFYSWRLKQTDIVPKGKRECPALRDKEDELRRTRDKGVVCQGSGLTVCELVDRYVLQKKGVRHTTYAGYKTVQNILKKDPFGAKHIDKVKLSDAKTWLIQLQEGGRSYGSIRSIRGVLRPAFQMAVDEDLILKNPFDFQLATVIVNDAVTREAITVKQEQSLLNFVRNDRHYCKLYNGIFILFKTGMRISEFCGLTISDLDMEKRTINIDHQLQRSNEMEYIIEPAKTKAGMRLLPMTEEVYECFKRIIENRPKVRTEPEIGGHFGFLFLDRNSMPLVAMHWEKYFQHIVEKYNRTYQAQMPKVTPHVCRHTYCSNMAKSGMNPKTLQYLMGHSNIGVTLNTYTHIKFEEAKAELLRMSAAGTRGNQPAEVDA